MRLLVLCGPTAAGKTDVALGVARAIGAEIVSADSMQVYRGLDIGTAKPSRDARAEVPHHLVDVAEVEETFSAGRFAAAADAAIRDARARGRTVLVSGGTMLYLRALLRGLVPAPADAAVRAALEAEPTEALRARLAALDPASAARLHPNDRVRIVRALEITLAAGEPASRLRERHGFAERRHAARVVALVPPWDRLRASIDARVERMMAAGLRDEAAWLVRRAGGRALPPLRALGYRQMAEHLAGHASLDEAVARIRSRTKTFARRQIGWIRGEPNVEIIATADDARARLLCDRAEAA